MPYQLDAKTRKDLDQGFRSLQEAEDLCARAAAAGWDMSAWDVVCQAIRKKLEGTQQQFVPGRKD